MFSKTSSFVADCMNTMLVKVYMHCQRGGPRRLPPGLHTLVAVGAKSVVLIEPIGVARTIESMLHDAYCEPASFVTEMYRRVYCLRYLLPESIFWRAMTLSCYRRYTSAGQSSMLYRHDTHFTLVRALGPCEYCAPTWLTTDICCSIKV